MVDTLRLHMATVSTVPHTHPRARYRCHVGSIDICVDDYSTEDVNITSHPRSVTCRNRRRLCDVRDKRIASVVSSLSHTRVETRVSVCGRQYPN